FIKDLCQQINILNEKLNTYILQQKLGAEAKQIKQFYSNIDFKQRSDKYRHLVEKDNAQEVEIEFRRDIQTPINFPDSKSGGFKALDIALMYYYNGKTITKPNRKPEHPTNMLASNHGYKNGENLYQVFNKINGSNKILTNIDYSPDQILHSITNILP